MSNELKKCPFCSGEAELEEIPASPHTLESWVWGLGCKECNIGWYKETKEEAITAWNTRAESDIEKAHRENRVIVLPVPIGGTVYVIYPEETDTDGSTLPAGVEETRLSGYINEDGREFYLTYDNLTSCDIPVADLYTRREAAEAALKEREAK